MIDVDHVAPDQWRELPDDAARWLTAPAKARESREPESR